MEGDGHAPDDEVPHARLVQSANDRKEIAAHRNDTIKVPPKARAFPKSGMASAPILKCEKSHTESAGDHIGTDAA